MRSSTSTIVRTTIRWRSCSRSRRNAACKPSSARRNGIATNPETAMRRWRRTQPGRHTLRGDRRRRSLHRQLPRGRKPAPCDPFAVARRPACADLDPAVAQRRLIPDRQVKVEQPRQVIRVLRRWPQRLFFRVHPHVARAGATARPRSRGRWLYAWRAALPVRQLAQPAGQVAWYCCLNTSRPAQAGLDNQRDLCTEQGRDHARAQAFACAVVCRVSVLRQGGVRRAGNLARSASPGLVRPIWPCILRGAGYLGRGFGGKH